MSTTQTYYTECYIGTISSDGGRELAVTVVPTSNYRIEQIKEVLKPSVLFVTLGSQPKQCQVWSTEDLTIKVNRIWMKHLVVQSKVAHLKVGLTLQTLDKNSFTCTNVIVL